jgi:hypothetical protein
MTLTRRSAPEDLRLAQSSALCPGARATFPLFFVGLGGGFVVLGGTANEPEPALVPVLRAGN